MVVHQSNLNVGGEVAAQGGSSSSAQGLMSPPTPDRIGDIERQSVRSAGIDFDVELAEQAEEEEKNLTLKQAWHSDRKVVYASIAFTGAIIMEGYGLALITYLFSFSAFRQKFGEPTLAKHGRLQSMQEEYEIAYVWKMMLPLMAQIGSIIGVFVAPPLERQCGYRTSVMLMLSFSACLIMIVVQAEQMFWLMLGYFVQGVPWGMYQVLCGTYVAEVGTAKFRPRTAMAINLAWVTGQLLASAVCKIFEGMEGDKSFRIPLCLQWVFVSIVMFLVWLAPESPYWHLKRGDVARARISAARLVRDGDQLLVNKKMAMMQRNLHQETKTMEAAKLYEDDNAQQGFWSFWRKRFSPECFKGVDGRRTEITCIIWLLQALCGSSLMPWAPKLFESAGLKASQAFTMNVALPSAGVFGTVLAACLVDRVGRRAIYGYGMGSMGILLMLCGASYYMPAAGWVAGSTLIVFSLFYNISVGPFCYAIVAEMPSIRLKSPTMAVARAGYLLSNILNHGITPKMVGTDTDSWGLGSRTGFVYGAICLFGMVYTFWRLPETRNLSPRELDVLFSARVKAGEFSQAKATELTVEERAREQQQQARPVVERPSVRDAKPAAEGDAEKAAGQPRSSSLAISEMAGPATPTTLAISEVPGPATPKAPLGPSA